MTEEQKSEAWNQMWRNFCVSDSFEPGSPAKPLTVAAALEEGVIGPQETFGLRRRPGGGRGHRIKCVSIYGHGVLSVEQTLMKSCNDAMMQIAARMGVERFARYQEIFGFGQKTGDRSSRRGRYGRTDLPCRQHGSGGSGL